MGTAIVRQWICFINFKTRNSLRAIIESFHRWDLGCAHMRGRVWRNSSIWLITVGESLEASFSNCFLISFASRPRQAFDVYSRNSAKEIRRLYWSRWQVRHRRQTLTDQHTSAASKRCLLWLPQKAPWTARPSHPRTMVWYLHRRHLLLQSTIKEISFRDRGHNRADHRWSQEILFMRQQRE